MRRVDLKLAKALKDIKFDVKVDAFITPIGIDKCFKPTTYYHDGDCIDELGGVEIIDYNFGKVDLTEFETHCRYFDDDGIEVIYSAPYLDCVREWFRDSLHVNVEATYLPNIKKYAVFAKPLSHVPKFHKNVKDYAKSTGKCFLNERFDSYYDALHAGINHAINLITDDNMEIK